MLDVVAATTDRDLTTTAALKVLILGATATSTVQDGQLSSLVRQASNWAETFLGYPASVQTYRETVASYGRRSLMLSRTPIIAVTRVLDATDSGIATEVLSSEYRVEDRDAGLLTRTQGFAWSVPLTPPGSGGPFLSSIPIEAGPMAGQEYKPWLVDYVAGWTYGGLSTASPNWSTGTPQFGSTSTGRTLPDDVEHGVLVKAQGLFLGGDEVASESLGDMATNYRSLGTDPVSGRLITRADALLGPYRRMA